MRTLRTRIIPALLLRNESLVKTERFNKFRYIGDPVNTCRIFNELEVDELAFFDITASSDKREPNYSLIQEIAEECFMPLSYGGGVSSVDIAERILQLGFEKVVLNTSALRTPKLINEISQLTGSQSVIVSIDVKIDFFGRSYCMGLSGRLNSKRKPVTWAKQVEEHGAGEILLTSIDREGTWKGFDLDLIKSVVEAVTIPVIAHGGAGSMEDISSAINVSGASAVALGSMVVYQKKGMGVLVNFPDERTLRPVVE